MYFLINKIWKCWKNSWYWNLWKKFWIVPWSSQCNCFFGKKLWSQLFYVEMSVSLLISQTDCLLCSQPDLNPFTRTLFHLNIKVLMVLKLSAKTTCRRKIWFLSQGPKTSRPIRMQDSFNCNINWIFVCK